MRSIGNGWGDFYSPLIVLDWTLKFHDRVLFTTEGFGKDATCKLDERGEQDVADQRPDTVASKLIESPYVHSEAKDHRLLGVIGHTTLK